MPRWLFLIAGIIIALVLLYTGALMGRYLLPAAQFEPQPLRDDPLPAAWEDFIRAQNDALDLYRRSAFFEDDQERAEAYLGVLYTLAGAIKVGAMLDHDHPRFARSSDWYSKSGLDNPDTHYLASLLDDHGSYLVRGSRGSSRNLVFQMLLGQPGVKGAGSSTPISVLYASDMQFDEQGEFELIVSRTDPGPDVNWLQLDDGAETLLVRYTHSDWSLERAGDLSIERLDGGGVSAPPLTPTTMAHNLQYAASSLYDRSATWLRFAQLAWNTMPRNGIAAARPSRGGLVGQYSAFGSWSLGNDEALILSTTPSSATYQGISLGSLWFVSLDYWTRTSSFTLDQLQCSDDGRCYTVISHRDPGIANWLDTGGHRRGLIMMRWQGLPAPLAERQQPQAQLVPLADLRKHLPADVQLMNAEQRSQQLLLRRRETQVRFGG